MTNSWWKLRRRRQNVSEELMEETSQTAESHMTDAPVAEITNEERGRLRRGPLTARGRFQLSQVERRVLRLLSLWYALTSRPGFQYLKNFVVFVTGCWLLGSFIRTYMFSHSQVFWFLKDCQLLDYYPSFAAFGYEQLDDLLGITDQDLIEIGVGRKAHRLRILAKARNKGHDPHILITLLCSFLVLQPLATFIFCACVMFHDGFKEKVKASLLWFLITVWCRIRLYQRSWREFTSNEGFSEFRR